MPIPERELLRLATAVQQLLSPVVKHRSPADGRKAVVRSAHANVDSRFDPTDAPNECPLVNRPKSLALVLRQPAHVLQFDQTLRCQAGAKSLGMKQRTAPTYTSQARRSAC